MSTPATKTDKVRLFLVDDHPLVLEGLRRLLETDERVTVVGEARSAEEGLDQLQTLEADVVVLDIRLPGMDGVEATGHFKARHPEVKVVIVSSFGDEYLMPSIEAGADGYMLKPSPSAGLVQGVLQAAAGQPPIDASLTKRLLSRVSDGSKAGGKLSLSPRQHELLVHVTEGYVSKEIASRLCISHATLKRELKNIFNLLGVNDRAHAVAEAYRRRIL